MGIKKHKQMNTNINAITKKEIKYYYTNDNTKGMFGIKKIIFGTAGINTPLDDNKFEYGMTETYDGN